MAKTSAPTKSRVATPAKQKTSQTTKKTVGDKAVLAKDMPRTVKKVVATTKKVAKPVPGQVQLPEARQEIIVFLEGRNAPCSAPLDTIVRRQVGSVQRKIAIQDLKAGDKVIFSKDVKGIVETVRECTIQRTADAKVEPVKDPVRASISTTYRGVPQPTALVKADALFDKVKIGKNTTKVKAVDLKVGDRIKVADGEKFRTETVSKVTVMGADTAQTTEEPKTVLGLKGWPKPIPFHPDTVVTRIKGRNKVQVKVSEVRSGDVIIFEGIKATVADPLKSATPRKTLKDAAEGVAKAGKAAAKGMGDVGKAIGRSTRYAEIKLDPADPNPRRTIRVLAKQLSEHTFDPDAFEEILAFGGIAVVTAIRGQMGTTHHFFSVDELIKRRIGNGRAQMVGAGSLMVKHRGTVMIAVKKNGKEVYEEVMGVRRFDPAGSDVIRAMEACVQLAEVLALVRGAAAPTEKTAEEPVLPTFPKGTLVNDGKTLAVRKLRMTEVKHDLTEFTVQFPTIGKIVVKVEYEQMFHFANEACRARAIARLLYLNSPSVKKLAERTKALKVQVVQHNPADITSTIVEFPFSAVAF